MKSGTISGSKTLGEGAVRVTTGRRSELGREEEANRWPSVEGLSSFPYLARVPFLL